MVRPYYDQRYADLQYRIILAEALEESYRKRGEVKKAHEQYNLQKRLKKELHELVMENADVTELKAEGTI